MKYKDDKFKKCNPPVNISSSVSLQSIFTGPGEFQGVHIGEVDPDGTWQIFDNDNVEIQKPWTTALGGLWTPPYGAMELLNGLKITTLLFDGELAVYFVKYK